MESLIIIRRNAFIRTRAMFPVNPILSRRLKRKSNFYSLHGELIRSSGYLYHSLLLLRFHVSRGLSVSEYIFRTRRRGTAVTGDSISFTNGPVTRGNFCNILNRTRAAPSPPRPPPSCFTGMGLHCLWTLSRRPRNDDSRNMHRLARLALRITQEECPRTAVCNMRRCINVTRDLVLRKLCGCYARQFRVERHTADTRARRRVNDVTGD